MYGSAAIRGLTCSGGFDPRIIPGLKFYFNADFGVSNPSGVSQWDDLSGQGNHVTQATVGNRPSLVTGWRNGRNALQFGSGKSIWRSSLIGGALAQPDTIIVIGDFPDESALAAAIDSRNGGGRQVLYDAGDHANYWQYATAGGAAARAGTGPGYKIGLYNGASSTLRQVHHGATPTTVSTPTIGSASLDGITIGAQLNDTGPMTGKIAAVIGYSGALTANQQAALERMIQSYWAISPS